MTNNMTEQKQVLQKIKNMRSRKLYMELFTCIIQTHTPYTQNKHGILFNLTALSPEAFSQVKKCCPNTNPELIQHLVLGSRPKTSPPLPTPEPLFLEKTWENSESAKTSPKPPKSKGEHYLGVP